MPPGPKDTNPRDYRRVVVNRVISRESNGLLPFSILTSAEQTKEKMTAVQIRLCHSLIEEHFGSTVAQVASALFQEGRTTVQNLAKLTRIPVKTIRESLLILLVRQMVSCAHADIEQSTLAASIGIKSLGRSLNSGGGYISPVMALDNCWYQLEFDMVLMIVRYPVFGKISKALFGQCGQQIAVNLFKYGILSKDMLISSIADSSVTEVLTNMLAQRFISTVDPSDFKSTIDQVITNEDEEEEKLDNVTRIATVKRKRVHVLDSECVQSTQKRRAVLLQKSKAIKAFDVASFDTDPEGNASVRSLNQKQLFRLNFSRYNLHLRSVEVIKYTRLFVNDNAASVMDIILKLSLDNDSDCLLLRTSKKISLSAVLHALKTGKVKLELPIYGSNIASTTNEQAGALNQYLDSLNGSQVGFLTKADGDFKVDFNSIVSHMRSNAIESYILDRFGERSMKLFRALSSSKILDEQGISKLTMVPQKEAREKLFQLFLNGFIEMQEVPRSQDRAPGRTIFCWRSSESVYENQLQKLYKSILNLRQRRFQEKGKIKILLEKMDRSDVVNDPSLLSNHERETFKRYESMLQRIVSYEIQLDNIIQVLKDF